MKKYLVSSLVLLLGVLTLASCSSKARMEKTVEEMNKQMPKVIAEGVLECQEVKIDGDYFVCIYNVTDEAAEQVYGNIENEFSAGDEAIYNGALKGYGDEFCKLLKDAKMGFRTIYQTKESKDEIAVIELTPEKVAEFVK